MISMLEKLTLEDRVVLLRFLVGLAYGAAVAITSLMVSPLTLSPIAWGVSVLVYYVTTIHVATKYRPLSRFVLYLRGLATFYGTWILIAILIYEAAAHLGLGT